MDMNLQQIFSFSLSLTQNQLYALAFLLGSFTVAALSDIKYMKAQKEFPEVWFLSIIVLLILDIIRAKNSNVAIYAFKWVFVFSVSLLSYRPVGILFKLEISDILASAAVMALLTPLFILIYLIILKASEFILAPFLVRLFGKREAYPFMPIILLATLSTFFLGLWLMHSFGIG